MNSLILFCNRHGHGVFYAGNGVQSMYASQKMLRDDEREGFETDTTAAFIWAINVMISCLHQLVRLQWCENQRHPVLS
jgi:hypothetical protein